MSELNIPNNWCLPELGEVLDIQGGSQPPKSHFKYEPQDGYIRLLQIRDFGEKPVPTFVPLNKVSKFCVKEDVLIARYGASLGRIVTGMEGAYNVALAKVINENQFFKSRYLFYLLKTPILQTPLAILSRSAQNGFAKHEIAHIKLPLPPLAEQHRIVAKIEELFSELDKGIKALKTAQEQLKVYRQAVLKYAFEGRLTNPDVKEGELPEGWVSEALSKLCNINPKLPIGNYEDNLEVTFLPMKQVSEVVNKIDVTETRKFKDVKKGFTSMTNGDVIFAKITPCMENGKIAVVHSLKNGIAFGSTEFHVLRCKESVLNAYVFQYLVQERTRYSAEENMTGAVGQRRVPKKFLEEYRVTIPSTIAEQQKVVDEIESRLSVCDKIEESIEEGLQQADALRQSILKSAFEGKLVPQDPTDEPASALLERIKAERAALKPIKRTRKSKEKA